MADPEDEVRTLTLDRGFKWIGPFFAALIPLAVWAFFIDRSEPPNVQGGLLCIAVLAFFATYGHLTAARTRFAVTSEGIESSGIVGVRTARWSEVLFATFDGSDLVFHLASGKPMKASPYLSGFDWLLGVVGRRGLLRSAAGRSSQTLS